MVDVIMLAIMCVFFALALLFVKACERIIGPDLSVAVVENDEMQEPEAA
jgi:hypothetical protein